METELIRISCSCERTVHVGKFSILQAETNARKCTYVRTYVLVYTNFILHKYIYVRTYIYTYVHTYVCMYCTSVSAGTYMYT